jgi:hypothetical protein
MSTATATAATKPAKLYTLNATLLADVEVKQAHTQKGDKPYVSVRVAQKNAKEVTIMTMAPKGIAALQGLKKGAEVRLFGVFTKGTKGRTYAAMGVSTPLPPKAKA